METVEPGPDSEGSVAEDLLAAFGTPPVKEAAADEEPVEAKTASEEAPVDNEAPSDAAPAEDERPSGEVPNQQPETPGGLATDAPALDPAAFFDLLRGPSAPTPVPQWPDPFFLPVQPPPKRRVLRLVLRWSAALLTAGAVGAATAFAVTLPRRTDIPGLATKNDGRYAFAAAKPPSPPSSPGATPPHTQNLLRHSADLRQYLLPAPVGAVPDTAYPGTSGWYSVKDFLAGLASADSLTADLGEYGLRRIAAEGWTTPDGQHTAVELLQFPDDYGASRFRETLATNSLAQLTDLADTDLVEFPDLDGTPGHIDIEHYRTVKSDAPKLLAPKEGHSATFTVGDVVVLVITTGPDHMTDLPTKQIVLLQAAMLR